MNELIRLEECYEYYKKDKEFQEELDRLLKEYAGRPSLLYYAEKMTKDLGGAKIYLKREDLNHTGPIRSTTCWDRCSWQKEWENQSNSGNGSRTAWCGNSNGSGAPWHGM